jgi:hypothetical protein
MPGLCWSFRGGVSWCWWGLALHYCRSSRHGGAALWYVLLLRIVRHCRTQFSPTVLPMMDRVAGSVLLLCAGLLTYTVVGDDGLGTPAGMVNGDICVCLIACLPSLPQSEGKYIPEGNRRPLSPLLLAEYFLHVMC